MEKVYSILIKTWNKVNYYRTHLKEVEFLKKIAEKRKRFYRLKTTFKLNTGPDGSNLVERNILFMYLFIIIFSIS